MPESQAVIELHWPDWIVVSLYALVMFSIAIWSMRMIEDCGGFLLGKRKIGLWMLMATGFAGGTNANHPMGVAAATFKGGMSGMWLSLTWILVTPFYWIYPPVARRLRVVTAVDMINLRFGRLMGIIFKIVGILTAPISMGLGLKSAAIVIEVMTGGAIGEAAAVYIIAIPTLIYTLMGGVVAAYATDVLQGVLIVILSFLMIPFAIQKAGGIAALGFEHKLRERGFREDDLEELDREVIHVDERDRQTSGRLILVDLLRIPKLIGAGEAKLSDYKVDLIGLIASIAFVILFIAGVQWLGKLF